MHAFGELAASVLPSNKREKDHDARLLLLMDHVLSLRGEKLKTQPYLLEKLSSAPNVVFPDHQVRHRSPRLLCFETFPLRQVTANEASTLLGSHALAPRDGQGVPLESYAFKLRLASGRGVCSRLLRFGLLRSEAWHIRGRESGKCPRRGAMHEAATA